IEMVIVGVEYDCIELLRLEQAALPMQGDRPRKRLCRIDPSGRKGGEWSLSHSVHSAAVRVDPRSVIGGDTDVKIQAAWRQAKVLPRNARRSDRGTRHPKPVVPLPRRMGCP